MRISILLFVLIFLPFAAMAGNVQNSRLHSQIISTAERFIQEQTSPLAGKVSFKVEPIDPRVNLASCSRLEAFLPIGGTLFGKTSIGVRCLDPNGWSILVPASIKVTQQLLVSSRQLNIGQTITPQDIMPQTVELTRPTGFTDAQQVIGKVLRFSIAAGQILRDDMLRPAYSVTQGQIVQITLKGQGFSVRNEGVALNNAIEGQNVQVRVASGRVIGGVANNGTVEIAP